MVTSEGIALDWGPLEEFELSGNEQTEVATDKVGFLLVVGTCRWFVIRRIPAFGKIIEVVGQSSVSGHYGLADRNNGFFSVVKRRSLTTLPSLLSDSINYLQKLKGTEDTVRKQVQAVAEPVKGLRERLAADSTEGEQTLPSPEENVRTLWDSVDEHGQRRKEWKQVCRDGWSEYHEGPNCTLEMFRNWVRNRSDPMAWLSQFLKEFDKGSNERTATELKSSVRCLRLSGVYDQLNGPNLCCFQEITHVAFVNLLMLVRVELMGSRIGLLSSGSPVCNPAPTSCRCP